MIAQVSNNALLVIGIIWFVLVIAAIFVCGNDDRWLW